MNDWYFFVLQAVVGNLCASRNLESISLSRGVVVVTNERDTSWAGGLTNKKYFLPVYFVFAVEIKCQCRQAFLHS